MGGDERLARQRAGGRLDARQRVAALLDPGTFAELGTLAGTAAGPADAFVAGSGRIDGRPVLVGAEDFTVLGGSIGTAGNAKRQRLTELAGQERVPLVLLLEGAGERAGGAGAEGDGGRRDRAPTDLQGLVALSGSVPTVVVVHGASAGHGALAAPLADWCLMVEGAALFAAGPPLVEAATGERVDKEELGGVGVHVAESGVAHDSAPDDATALARVRRYLSYFPANAWEAPARVGGGEAAAAPRSLERLAAVLPSDPRRPYDVHDVLALVFDDGSWLEVGAGRGGALVCGLARLGGWPVAVVANQPAVRAGALDGPACDKGARFVEVAGAFRLPVVFLADNPGVLAGTAAERSGVLRRAARLYAAQARHPGPKLHVTLRKAYGFGSSLMAMNPFEGQTVSLALPGVELAAMPGGEGEGEGGDEDEDGDGDEDGDATGGGSSGGGGGNGRRAAERLSYDEVVAPAELRDRLLAALDLASARLSARPDGPLRRPGTLP